MATPYLRNGERWGVFVELRSSCALRRSDVLHASDSELEKRYFVELRLAPSGVKKIRKCRNRANSRDDSPSFLFVLNGEILGNETLFFQSYTDADYLHLSGGREVRQIVKALGTPITPTTEL